MSRLDDTARCPRAKHCEACGDAGDLTVTTARLDVGVPCLTLCRRCLAHGRTPAWSLSEAVRRVLHHCRHIGVTVDEMAELLRQEDQNMTTDQPDHDTAPKADDQGQDRAATIPTHAEVMSLIRKYAVCVCPSGLVARGGFRSGCPVHHMT